MADRVMNAADIFAAGGALANIENGHVIIGNSIDEQNSLPAYGVARMLDEGWFTWLQAFSGHRVVLLANLAVGGTTIAQVSATVSAALALRPGSISVGNAINDVPGIVTENDMLAFLAMYEAMCLRILNANVRLWLMTTMPFGVGHANQNAANYQKICRINAWARAFARAHRGVRLLDFHNVAIDHTSTGNGLLGVAKSGILKPDQIHPATNGARALGYAAYLAVANDYVDPFWLAQSQANNYSLVSAGNQLLDNSFFLGSSGTNSLGAAVTAASVIPTGVNVQGSGGTAVNGIWTSDTIAITTPPRADGYGQDMRVEVQGAGAPSATGLGAFFTIRFPDISSRVVAGDRLRFVSAVKMTGLTGFRGLRMFVQTSINGTTFILGSTMEKNSTLNLAAAYTDQTDTPELTLVTGEITVPAGGTIQSTRASVSPVFDTGGKGVVTFARAELQRRAA